MDASDLSNFDLEKLNEKDKAELRQFLGNENQKARVQSTEPRLSIVKAGPAASHANPRLSRERYEFRLTSAPPLSVVVHSLTDMCWKKCVTGSIKQGAMDKNEQSCMANCADRFLDASSLTMKHLQNLRQG
ncbi:hypothetical protein JX265_007643 [Neoarthrinium moseri]|uniref:Mitochondrial import inner membrane translocase subunit n=1 Tax=Neoarthrinium moseri TaxID=1658444 RepID=A0A9P9WJV7_9PEZI|nr:hypothetical protein JX265_007643 [Neoarthrinium moseri]